MTISRLTEATLMTVLYAGMVLGAAVVTGMITAYFLLFLKAIIG